MIPLVPALAGATLVTGYLDAKYFLSKDLGKVVDGLQAMSVYREAVPFYEDNCSAYHALHRTRTAESDAKTALVFEGRAWTYRQVRREVDRLATELVTRFGLRNREYVVMYLDNSPEFYFLFWACVKIGAIPATVNTSLAKDRLKFCVNLPRPVYLFTTYELYGKLAESVKDDPFYRSKIICYDYGSYSPALGKAGAGAPHDTTQSHLIVHWNLAPSENDGDDWIPPKVNRKEPGMLLYTSGTTGLPKASIIPAFFLLAGSIRIKSAVYQETDRIYSALPFFHGTSVLVAMVPALSAPSTLIIARKFSTRTFWEEVKTSRATVVVYIGDMVRYLCQAPTRAGEKDHAVRLFFGLGLQNPTYWHTLRHRFGIPAIQEYYGSTEGTGAQFNYNTNDLGLARCGHKGPLLRRLDKRFVLVKHDFATGKLYRRPDGLCEEVKVGEPGEAMTFTDDLSTSHDYLNNKEASSSKIARNVLVNGDAYVRMGDLMEWDSDGFLIFRDRLGDTYRIKGHNISTTEVEECLAQIPEVESCSVYPMNAQGMAAIVLVPTANQALVATSLERKLIETGLPKYAVPHYLRFVQSIRTTETFKIAKNELKAMQLNGQVYVIQREGQGYIPMAQTMKDAKL